jgi:AraC-like DNA-binding protein
MEDLYEAAAQSMEEGKNSLKCIALYGSSVLAEDSSGQVCDDGRDRSSSEKKIGRHCCLENESGTDEIAVYHVFPGIELIYNDMHMEYCNRNQRPAPHTIEMNYCREGRCECLFGEEQYCYMSAGDLAICSLHEKAHQSVFPTSHYHGITVTIDFPMIGEEQKRGLGRLSIDLKRLQELTEFHGCTILRARPELKHIFEELYTVPEEIRKGYIRIKVLELLLILTGFPFQETAKEREHYSTVQIGKIKEIHSFLIHSYSEHYTIEMLSVRAGISPTSLKKCFRGIYGESIYAYMKQYRLQVAEKLLRETDLTIEEIAAEIGYNNPNKFTTAFGKKYGMSPSFFRRERGIQFIV